MAKSPFSSPNVEQTLNLMAKGHKGGRAAEIARLLLSNEAPAAVSFILKARQNFRVDQEEALGDVLVFALSNFAKDSPTVALTKATESARRKYEKERRQGEQTAAIVVPASRQSDDKVQIYADILPDESSASPESSVLEAYTDTAQAPQIAQVFKAHGIGEQLRQAFGVVAAYERDKDRTVALNEIARRTASDKNDIHVLFDAYLQLTRAASHTQNPLAELESIPSGNTDERLLSILSRSAR